MKEIARRVWHEPAVALGLLASIAIAVITILTGDPWDTATIAGVAGPLVSALGIRQLVTPIPLGPSEPITVDPPETPPE